MKNQDSKSPEADVSPTRNPPGDSSQPVANDEQQPREIGGRKGPDPTRFGDWEKNGRCIDF